MALTDADVQKQVKKKVDTAWLVFNLTPKQTANGQENELHSASINCQLEECLLLSLFWLSVIRQNCHNQQIPNVFSLNKLQV